MTVWDGHLLFGIDHWMHLNNPTLPYTNGQHQISEDVVCSLITPFPSSPNQAYLEENQRIFDYVRKNPSAIAVFALNPSSPENREAVSDFVSRQPCCGIVLWPILCRMDLSELVRDGWFRDFMNRFSGFTYIHTGAGNEQALGRVAKQGSYGPQQVLAVAEAFPKNKFILGHLLRLSEEELRKAKHMDNVVLDTSLISGHQRWFERDVNVFPAVTAGELAQLSPGEILEKLCGEYGLGKKLVFGSSYPYCQWWGSSYEDELRLITEAKISQEMKQDILQGNLQRFLGF